MDAIRERLAEDLKRKDERIAELEAQLESMTADYQDAAKALHGIETEPFLSRPLAGRARWVHSKMKGATHE